MRTLLLGGLIFLLVGCGFQLQGNYQLPAELEQLRVSAPQFSEFADEARERFRLAGATLVNDSSATHVEILNDSLSRRTLSLSASGQVAEYELIYAVNYLLVPRQGKVRHCRLKFIGTIRMTRILLWQKPVNARS
ncbi:LPS-assembly lipoprotein LptE [Pseudidiomarina halophila]|uniref:LPS-assembly lipoprotein LptE n=1 Tax=Pseudidiomarina halophila TaxID=1449799 RepID=UPI0036119B86